MPYDPSVDEMFTARRGEGAFLNGERLNVKDENKRVIYNLAKPGSAAFAYSDRLFAGGTPALADEMLAIISNR